MRIPRILADALLQWKKGIRYTNADDWVFASKRYRGRRPIWGQAILRKYIRPVAQRVGIEKRFGWHTFRHTYSTLLRSVGTEFKVMQELLRHSSFRSTLDVYTQAVTPAKYAAQAAVLLLVFSPGADGDHSRPGRKLLPHSLIRRTQKGRETRPFRARDGFDGSRLTLLERMAGTTRLELATSAVTEALSTTWKSTDGTASHWKYIIDTLLCIAMCIAKASVSHDGSASNFRFAHRTTAMDSYAPS